MSDEKENAGGWIQDIIAFIKKSLWGATYIAKGEVAAMEIKADGMVAIMEKHADYDVSWKKGNLESISRKSEEHMPTEGREKKAKNLNREWASTFADKSGNISDEDMQVRWAKILAGEVDNPGTFSKRTLSVLSDMSKEDAESFTSFCQFVWLERNKNPVSLIYDYGNSIYNQKEIKFSTLQHLEAIGLISTHSYRRYYLEPQPITWYYHGTAVVISPKKYPQEDRYYISTGKILLTQSGKELFPISSASRNDEFFNYVINKWQEEGYSLVIQNPEAE